jgi:hypothetical protein
MHSSAIRNQLFLHSLLCSTLLSGSFSFALIGKKKREGIASATALLIVRLQQQQ